MLALMLASLTLHDRRYGAAFVGGTVYIATKRGDKRDSLRCGHVSGSVVKDGLCMC